MSSAAANMSTTAIEIPARAIGRRMMWKESRLLWGLWLTVFVAAVVLQCSIRVLYAPAAGNPGILLTAGWAMAVLFAVGAAATTFSLEHEEGTYNYLACLPTTTWPLYWGKLLVVAVLSIALAAGVSVSGWLLSGLIAPSHLEVHAVLGLFGVAILEAIAWGTLFSLLTKRPLVAAVLAIVAGTVAVNLAVYLSWPSSGANLQVSAYVEAAPLRLAAVAVVAACGALAARRWLARGAAADAKASIRPLTSWRVIGRTFSRVIRRGASANTSAVGIRTTLPKLLWQTWRDAKSLLALPLLVAAALLIGTWAAIILIQPGNTLSDAAYTATSLFVPALYGAMAFAGDQRRRQYRFLSEHSGAPGLVWLARHVVWLGAVSVIALVLWLAANVMVAAVLPLLSAQSLEAYLRFQAFPSGEFEFTHTLELFFQGIGLACQATFTAYAVGQFCSMFVRSEILASVLALLASILLTAWAGLLYAWELSGILFLLPLAVTLMWATWLRAPGWIADRNRWSSWFKPALPVALSLIAMAIALPPARLAQTKTSLRGRCWADIRGTSMFKRWWRRINLAPGRKLVRRQQFTCAPWRRSSKMNCRRRRSSWPWRPARVAHADLTLTWS